MALIYSVLRWYEQGLYLRVILKGEEDFFWIRLVFSRREGLLLDPGYPDGFWIYAGITSTRLVFSRRGGLILDLSRVQ